MIKLLPFYVILLIFVVGINSCQTEANTNLNNQPNDTIIKPYKPNIEYGFNLDSFSVYRDTVQPDWTLSHILSPYNVSQFNINLAANYASDSVVGLKYVKKGKPFIILTPLGDTTKTALYCIYPKNMIDYIIFDFSDSVVVTKKQKPNKVTEKMLSGEIIKNSNLTFAINRQLKNANMTGEMTEYIAGIFAWNIDFFKLYPGDEFKVIYEEQTVEGKPYKIKNVKHAYFKHQNSNYYAFYYVLDSTHNKFGYFDEKGKEMKRPFLMAPVKYSRISSGYSSRRFHPVQKRWKAHLGTDYAAPKGTPIMATADGYVIASSYTGGNGNYVKIKHNDTYSTQYLHMSKRAVKKGQHVKQGEIIGYVGSTGLATGPHVCYRFWKNGKQINHRAEKFPSSIPMVDSLLPNYLEYIKPIKAQLDSFPIHKYIIKDSLQ
ncbi:MAG TPA: M23 family peptidase [Crocinitomix sp.]|nr:M23 family peptidase [Crocinitomix sp.]